MAVDYDIGVRDACKITLLLVFFFFFFSLLFPDTVNMFDVVDGWEVAYSFYNTYTVDVVLLMLGADKTGRLALSVSIGSDRC